MNSNLSAELKTLQAAIDKNWIETKDELPPDDSEVLIFLNGYCDINDIEARKGGAWGIRKGWYDHEEGQWYRRQSGPVTHWQPGPKMVSRFPIRKGQWYRRQSGPVTHWQPLPPPPSTTAWRIGVKVIRHIEELPGKIVQREGQVVAISDETITCLIWTPDGLSTMEFDKKTGVNVLGEDCGYITAEINEACEDALNSK